MNIIHTHSELITYLASLPTNTSIGFVPTMGALHSGHKSLIIRCLRENSICVCSVFVNPKQFENKHDFSRYPSNISNDIILLKECGCQVLFHPDLSEIYPQNLESKIFQFNGIENILEGASRQGHFHGVAKIVSRLFDLVKPSRAYFGQKDAQQLYIIESLQKQAYPKIEIVSCPIIRDDDGLAMSSRNELLSEPQRNAASRIYSRLLLAKNHAEKMSIKQLKKWMRNKYMCDTDLQLDYFEISDPKTFISSKEWGGSKEHLACIAVYAGEIRLIDNIFIEIN